MAPKSQENMEERVESPRPGSKDPTTPEPPKPPSKIIRVLTVFVYVLSVSLTAILLSIYYIFLWEGRPHLGALVAVDMRNGTENETSVDRYFNVISKRVKSTRSKYKIEQCFGI